jgi:hypothetical protein
LEELIYKSHQPDEVEMEDYKQRFCNAKEVLRKRMRDEQAEEW